MTLLRLDEDLLRLDRIEWWLKRHDKTFKKDEQFLKSILGPFRKSNIELLTPARIWNGKQKIRAFKFNSVECVGSTTIRVLIGKYLAELKSYLQHYQRNGLENIEERIKLLIKKLNAFKDRLETIHEVVLFIQRLKNASLWPYEI